MQCLAILKSGNQCRRRVAAGSETCSLHSTNKPQPHPFYARGLSAYQRKTLAAAAQVEGVTAEIAVLRTFISAATAAGDTDAARRNIESLARLMRSEQKRGASTKDLATWLQETLAELDAAPPYVVGGS